MKTICALVDINLIIDDMAKQEPFVKLFAQGRQYRSLRI
jgi:hypothetical protein